MYVREIYLLENIVIRIEFDSKIQLRHLIWTLYT